MAYVFPGVFPPSTTPGCVPVLQTRNVRESLQLRFALDVLGISAKQSVRHPIPG